MVYFEIKKIKHMTTPVHCYSIWDHDKCESLIVLHVVLLFPVLSKVVAYSWDLVRHCFEILPSQLTFDFFFSIIPTHSSNPTIYLPIFWPSCAPDKALNPITAPLIFPSFTSIQCTVTPQNAIFVISADHPSWVMDIFPEATSVSFSSMHFVEKKRTCIYFFFQLLHVLHKLVVKRP